MDSYAALWLGKAHVTQLYDMEMEECPLGPQVSQAGSCGVWSPLYKLKAIQRIFPHPATGECGVGRRVSTLDSASVYVGDLSSNIWLQGKGIQVSILWEESPEPDQKDTTSFENIFSISLVQSFQQVKRPLLGFAFWSQAGTCSPTEEDSLGKNPISEVGRFLSWDNFIHHSRIYLTLLVSSVKINVEICVWSRK